MDKGSTPVRNDSDNIVIFSLYGTTSGVCQGGDSKAWFREEGLSELEVAPKRSAAAIRPFWQELHVAF